MPPLADHTGAWFERRLSAEIADHICTFLPWNRDALTGLVENLLRGRNQVKRRKERQPKRGGKKEEESNNEEMEVEQKRRKAQTMKKAQRRTPKQGRPPVK